MALSIYSTFTREQKPFVPLEPGRVKMYEKIVKGDNFLEAGLPESFNVLVKELMSLGLDVTLHQEDGKKKPKRIGFMRDQEPEE